MGIETLKNADGKVCVIKYTTAPVRMAISALGWILCTAIVFWFLVTFFINHNTILDTNLPSHIVIYSVVFLGFIVSAISILRTYRYIYWIQHKPIFIFERDQFTIQELKKIVIYRWNELARITPVNFHLIFKSGKRILVPPDFWQRYDSKIFNELLGDALSSKVKTKFCGIEFGKISKFGP